MRLTAARLYFLPVQTRVPLKFGAETLTSVTCARVALRVTDERGNEAEGWGETPLSVQWVWPSPLPYAQRLEALQEFCRRLVPAWLAFEQPGHPLEIGSAFQEKMLPQLLAESKAERAQEGHPSSESKENFKSGRGRPHSKTLPRQPEHSITRQPPGVRPPSAAFALEQSLLPSAATDMPWLAALVCNSAFDLALHDAFGRLVVRPVYETYGPAYLRSDLSQFLEPAPGTSIAFHGRYPADFLIPHPPQTLRAWHLVGGLDALSAADLTGHEPQDGHPVLLPDWIARDGLKCLKIKLRGTDPAWDYTRLVQVGQIATATGVECLSADFNCTVQDPAYVNEILDRLHAEHPRIYELLLYVEQPFPYELEAHRIDVHRVSARKPLFLDESAHDWRLVRLGRELGWTGVALKTCKTQTGALLSACWAKAHGLSLMVQDLTNPMLAQIPHVLLAAHVGTLRGVETNAMQFYPAASAPEAKVHPGLYQRRNGNVDLSTVRGPGFGYRVEEIARTLPAPDLALTR